jgi:SOUL heme-binding protein
MKPTKLLIILGIIGIISVPFAFLMVTKAMSAPLPSGFPSPTVHDQIEVKRYPAYRSGTYKFEGNLNEATNLSFNPLFRHISSNNISMTAPVEARYPISSIDQPIKTGTAKISFLYNNSEVNPQQVAQDIEVEDHAAMLVVSLGVQGKYGYQNFQAHIAKLKLWLTTHPEYEIAGEPREFLYDSPFTPDPLKRREVQIPIRER